VSEANTIESWSACPTLAAGNEAKQGINHQNEADKKIFNFNQ